MARPPPTPLEGARTTAALRDHVMTILLFPVSLTPLEDTNITQLTLTATCCDHVFPPPSITIIIIIIMLQCAPVRGGGHDGCHGVHRHAALASEPAVEQQPWRPGGSPVALARTSLGCDMMDNIVEVQTV